METVANPIHKAEPVVGDISKPITFSLAKFRFVIKPVGTMHLPPYKGATLRGGFGYAFKDLVCIKQDRQCETCLIQERCPYFQIFETPVPKGATMMRKYTRAPHPFVLTPPLDPRTELSEKDELAFELVLIGHAIDHLPYFIYVFEELGRRGIGLKRSQFHLIRVESYYSVPPAPGHWSDEFPRKIIYDGSIKTLKNSSPPIAFADFQHANFGFLVNVNHGNVSLNFLTPARIWTQGKLDHEFEFTNLMKGLLRRVQLLQYFHCLRHREQEGSDADGIFTLTEIHRLLALSDSVQTVARNLRYRERRRFSTRQERYISLSGFMGDISFSFLSPNHCAEFLPFLRLGTFIHVGRNTSFGLGRFEILLDGNNN